MPDTSRDSDLNPHTRKTSQQRGSKLDGRNAETYQVTQMWGLCCSRNRWPYVLRQTRISMRFCIISLVFCIGIVLREFIF